MKSRNVIVTLVLVVAVWVFVVFRSWREPQRKEAFDRTPQRLEYTAYVLCRMKCLQLDKDAIEEVMQRGVIIFNKSNRRRWPCPSLSLQSRTIKGHYLRVVFEQCKNRTTVLNIYNLEKEVPCNCADEKQ